VLHTFLLLKHAFKYFFFIGFDTRASALERTEAMEFHNVTNQLPGSQDEGDRSSLPLRLSIADFPGTTDERAQIAQVKNSKEATISNLKPNSLRFLQKIKSRLN
jgi:hypothetical protein